MKKFIENNLVYIVAAIILVIYLAVVAWRGNLTILDTKWDFNTAVITIGDEVKEVSVKSWKDYDDGTVQIVSEDGTVFVTHYTNVVLMSIEN